MENYRLLERLGKGGQGSVYLAEHKQENKKYVLKKVECYDESEANKAFHEALALQKLDHLYVCGYKEFFVMWDKEESSMFVCIVMDYYKNGDLRSVIREYQQKMWPMPEEKIKKFLGETLEALMFVHKQGIIHRDIKPSNIFIKDDGTMCLGDFGVSTMMDDRRTCPRNTVGTTMYMAPEVMTQAYDERSDVWSLGCILLEMLTTQFLNQEKLAKKLEEIKKDPDVLEYIYDDIAKHFNPEWIKTLRTMMKVKHQARPTPELLLKMEFVQECMNASDSSLVDKRRRQKQTSDRIRPLKEQDLNLEQIIQYMADTIDHEECVKDAMEALRDLINERTQAEAEGGVPLPPVTLDQASKNLITLAMWDNISNKDIQIAGCAVLAALVIGADPGDVLFTPEVLSVIGKIMKTHRGHSDVQQEAASLIVALSTNTRASEAICQLGGIQDILENMRLDPDNAQLAATSCNALWGLTIVENNAKIAAEAKAIKEVCEALERHSKSAEVAEAAAAAMASLCLDDGCFDIVNKKDGVGSLLAAMETHVKNPKVVRNVCMALSTVVEPNEECAYRVLTSDKPDDGKPVGIPIIIRAYELHRDNAEVVEAIVNLVMELCEYDDVNAEMRAVGVGPSMLAEVYKRYKENKDIIVPCETALDKLGAGKAMAPRQSSVQVK